MLAVNRPIDTDPQIIEPVEQKPKTYSLSRRDVNPSVSTSPVFTNEKISPVSIECSQDLESGENFQKCRLKDSFGQTVVVRKISFVNHQVSNPSIMSYKHPNGTIVTQMNFQQPADCELFGLNATGLTLKCVDKQKPTKDAYFENYHSYK